MNNIRDTTKNKYYNGKQILSYGTPFLFSLGNRSIGKSFYWTERCINKYLRDGKKFIYMRRYDDDLKRVAPSFFDNVAFKHPDLTLTVGGNGKSGSPLYINGEQAGITVALSAANKYKSVGMADYDTIFFDEFLPENGEYLPTEVANALSFYQSVARGYGQVIREEVKFVFVANNVTLNNPYFRELGIRDKVRFDTRYTCDADRAWVVELTNNAEIASEIAKTPFGKMIAKTKYGDYALKSQFYLDDSTFVQKPKGASKYYCTLEWAGKAYGLYEYSEEGLIYISNKVDPNCKLVFSMSTADHKPNYVMLYKARYNPIMDFIRYAYDNALLRFENDECKFMFMDFMSYRV